MIHGIEWAAGLYEGEGTIDVRKNSAGERIPAGLRLSMTDEDAVRTFHSVIGTGKVKLVRKSHPRQDLWMWIVSSLSETKEVLSKILPYLHKRRAKSAEWALEYINRPKRGKLQIGDTCVNGHLITKETLSIWKRPGYNAHVCRICAKHRNVKYRSNLHALA